MDLDEDEGPLKLRANLPMLGVCETVLHVESADIVRLFGFKREFARLRKVPHLGVAAYTVTGINHSRLEYTLLQCAIISIVAKQFKGDSSVALSNNVKIPGQPEPVSSGEELLKSWALLGNFGHLQHTYAEERAYLRAARDRPDIARWFCASSRDTATRRWIRHVIEGAVDEQMHYVLCYRRIAGFPPRNRRKGLAERILSSLLLPIDAVHSSDASARFKLIRLRHVYRTVRLLSMLAIDSYYSAQPIRFQIAQSVLGLPEFMAALASEDTHLQDLLQQTAGWLADGLYLGPDVITLRAPYEHRIASHIERTCPPKGAAQRLQKLLKSSLHNGTEPVQKGTYEHLLRLTLRTPYQRRLIDPNKFSAAAEIQREVVAGERALASVDINPFSNARHIDLLVERTSTASKKWELTERLIGWAVRAVEVQALSELRRLIPGNVRADKEKSEPIRRRFLARILPQHYSLAPQIFMSVMHQLMPPGWSLEIEREGQLARDETTIRPMARLAIDFELDEITPYLDEQIDANPHSLSSQELHEFVAVRRVLKSSGAEVVIASTGKVRIKNQVGRVVDEIDGILVECRDKKLSVTFIEAKTAGNARQREDAALAQLAATRAWIRKRVGFSCVRKRIKGIGAKMIVHPAH